MEERFEEEAMRAFLEEEGSGSGVQGPGEETILPVP
jgi:hypothetical protein